nr:hypothetical protein [Tanacetum cinerariifolium]
MCEMVGQLVQKKQEEKQIQEDQAANARYWIVLAYYDDDDDYNFAITPNEPVDSLIMGDKHLNTIPAAKSNKLIKSSVENLVPNPSASEGENGCDMPACFTTFSNVLFDDEYDFDCVDDHKSFMEEIDLTFTPNDPMPSGIKEDDDDSRDILIREELLDNYSLLLPENESFYFDIPSSSRPPAKPPDGFECPSILGNVKTHTEGFNLPSLHFLSFNWESEQVLQEHDKVNEGTSRPKEKLQKEPTPTPRSWRLYIGREPSKKDSGSGMVLVDPEEREYSHAIRLNLHASKEDMDYEAFLARLIASVGRGMKDLHVFFDSRLLVDQVEGNRVLRTEGAKRYMEAIMDATTPFYRLYITHLPKALNPKAEALTGLASIQLEFLNQEVLVGVKTRPLVEAQDKHLKKNKRLVKESSIMKIDSHLGRSQLEKLR